ncbi:MAG: thioredoxin family protein [Phycisphaerae bacterium]|nr:thioredoxin family protein [Phycisphaerae bacterium]
MKNVLTVVVLLIAIGAVVATKQLRSTIEPKPDGDVTINKNIDEPLGSETGTKSKDLQAVVVNNPDKAAAEAISEKALAAAKLPRLLELGSVNCIPCKMMKRIIDELTIEYEGSMLVEFIDVWADESAGRKYKIQTIPTQIFFASDGTELFRHVGFFPKEDILAKWKELGVDLSEAK